MRLQLLAAEGCIPAEHWIDDLGDFARQRLNDGQRAERCIGRRITAFLADDKPAVAQERANCTTAAAIAR
jgi:hypothetical protein